MTRVELPDDQVDLLLSGRKTQVRVPLGPDETESPHRPLDEVEFSRAGESEAAGRFRVLAAEAQTVYGIVLGDAIAEGFRSAVRFNEWWKSRHGRLDGHCWRLVVELVVELSDHDEQVIRRLYGDDGKRPLFWQPRPDTGDRDLADSLEARHLVHLDRALGGYALTPQLGRRVGRSLKAGRRT